jgi:hypothetical protein
MSLIQTGKIFFVTILSILFAQVPLVFAQAQEEEYVASDQEMQLFVDDISIATNNFRPGEIVSGTFKLHNVGATVISDVRYRIELVTLFEEEGFTFPSEALHASPISEGFLLPRGAETISFAYTLPKQIPDTRLGLLVQTYVAQNTPSAYEFIEFSVIGGATSFLPKQATVVINGDEVFELLEGPTVEKNETVQVETMVENDTATTVSLTPTLQIFAGPHTNSKIILEKQLPLVTIPAGDTATSVYDMPVATEEPGVYTALISYTSVDDVSVTPLEARYIISGLRPKLESVTYNVVDVINADNVFEIYVKYMDTPINMRKNADGTFKDPRAEAFFSSNAGSVPVGVSDMAAEVRLSDALTGELLYEETLPFEEGSVDVIARISELVAVTDVLVEVSLLEKGEIIDTYTNTLTLKAAEKKNFFLDLWNNHPMAVLALGLGALFIIILGVLLVHFRKTPVVTNTM